MSPRKETGKSVGDRWDDRELGGTRGKEATGCQNRKDRFQLTDVRRGRKERQEEDQDDGNRADCKGGQT